MVKRIVHFNVSIAAGITAILALSSILSTTTPVTASSDESLSQKKDVHCDDGMHTILL